MGFVERELTLEGMYLFDSFNIKTPRRNVFYTGIGGALTITVRRVVVLLPRTFIAALAIFRHRAQRARTLTNNFAVLLMIASCAPSGFAVPELKLSSGATSVDIVDTAAKDSCKVEDCVTYIGAVGSWQVDVTTGMEGELPFFDLNSINAIQTAGQKAPLTIYFSDDGLTLPPGFVFDVGGTMSSTSSKLAIAFTAWTDKVKFGHANEIGSMLTFNTGPFSGTTKGLAGAKNSATTIGATIDLGSGNARGTTGFDAGLTSDSIAEPASIWMLGGALLLIGSVLRRRRMRAGLRPI